MEKKQKSKKKWLLMLLLLLLVAGGGYYFIKSNKLDLLFDPASKKYDAKIKEPVNWSEDKIAFPSFGTVKAIEGEGYMYVALANPSFNKAYIKFEMTMDNDEKSFYKSGLVRPGEAVTEVKLPDDIATGQHIIHLNMKGYASDGSDIELNGTTTDFTLMILKE